MIRGLTIVCSFCGERVEIPVPKYQITRSEANVLGEYHIGLHLTKHVDEMCDPALCDECLIRQETEPDHRPCFSVGCVCPCSYSWKEVKRGD